jgi:membrane protease YdiL (CAAX protease family)
MTGPAAIIALIWSVLTLPVIGLAAYRVKRGPSPWTVADAVLAFCVLLWVALGPSVVILFGMAESMADLEANSSTPPANIVGPMLACSMLGSGTAALYGWLRAGPEALGVDRLSWSWVLGSALLTLPLFGFFWALETMMVSIGVEPMPQLISLVIAEMDAGVSLLLMMLMVIFGAPLFEEVVFRGFIQPALIRRTGVWVGLTLTAAVFALIHGPDLHAVGPVFVLGLTLGWLRQRTGTVTAPIILHILNNAGAMLLVRTLGT